MIICQNCRVAVQYHSNACVYLSATHATYLCVNCVEVVDPDTMRDLPPLRVCNECYSANEFYSHCFTCLNDKVFWSMLAKNKKVGV
jgi:hypothetical protein